APVSKVATCAPGCDWCGSKDRHRDGERAGVRMAPTSTKDCRKSRAKARAPPATSASHCKCGIKASLNSSAVNQENFRRQASKLQMSRQLMSFRAKSRNLQLISH